MCGCRLRRCRCRGRGPRSRRPTPTPTPRACLSSSSKASMQHLSMLETGWCLRPTPLCFLLTFPQLLLRPPPRLHPLPLLPHAPLLLLLLRPAPPRRRRHRRAAMARRSISRAWTPWPAICRATTGCGRWPSWARGAAGPPSRASSSSNTWPRSSISSTRWRCRPPTPTPNLLAPHSSRRRRLRGLRTGRMVGLVGLVRPIVWPCARRAKMETGCSSLSSSS